MKKQILIGLLAILITSQGCQLLSSSPAGTVISNCTNIVSAMAEIQSGEVPDHLLETGKKQGDEFDTNQYFDVLTNLSMQAGYALDYVYQNDDLGGYPLLYVRPVDQAPYVSGADIPDNTELPDFHEHVNIQDTEQGYFEYVVMDIMADQFYLYWHANYNDTEIVCDRREVNDIVERLNSGDFGAPMNFVQQARARAIRNVEPVVNLRHNVVDVQVITFSKWGGFYRETYTIDRNFPHTVINIKQQTLVLYDCGVAF
jgi:hypothetical protein